MGYVPPPLLPGAARSRTARTRLPFTAAVLLAAAALAGVACLSQLRSGPVLGSLAVHNSLFLDEAAGGIEMMSFTQKEMADNARATADRHTAHSAGAALDRHAAHAAEAEEKRLAHLAKNHADHIRQVSSEQGGKTEREQANMDMEATMDMMMAVESKAESSGSDAAHAVSFGNTGKRTGPLALAQVGRDGPEHLPVGETVILLTSPLCPY